MTNELSENARTLLDRARRQGGPTAAQKARLTASVMAATVATTAAASTAGGVGAATVGKATVGGASVLKLVGAGLLATVVGVSGTVAMKYTMQPASGPVAQQLAPELARPQTSAPLAAQSAVEASAPPPEPIDGPPVVQRIEIVQALPQPVGPNEVTGKPRPRGQVLKNAEPLPEVESEVAPSALAIPSVETPRPVTQVALEDSSAAEVAALGSAMEALDSGRFLEALDTARSARLAYPRGVLRPELTLVEIESLCALNRRADALAVAADIPSADRSPLVVQKLGRSCVGGRE